MLVLIFALLPLVSFANSFGSFQKENQQLKKTNSALLKTLRSLTVEKEKAVGGDCISNCDRWDAPCSCCNEHCMGDHHLWDQCYFARCGGRAEEETKIGAPNHPGFIHVNNEKAVGGDCIANCDRWDAPCSCCNEHCMGDQHLWDQCYFARCGGRSERAVGGDCDHITEANKSYECTPYYSKIKKCSICLGDGAGAVDNSAINADVLNKVEPFEKAVGGDCISNCDRWDAPCSCCNEHCMGDQHLWDQCYFARCGGRSEKATKAN